jgi:predicted small metal-binding protein
MAREMTCDCGRTIAAQDDEQLFHEAKEHIHYEHPDMIVTDGQIRDMVAAKARDASTPAQA